MVLFYGIIIIVIEKLEKHIIKHITLIIFLLIILLFTEWNKIPENKDLYLIVGALFAFWYWYKKHERNKEIEIIEKYWKEYDEIKGNKDNTQELLNLFYKEFYLKSKWYIDNALWNELNNWISLDIFEMISLETRNIIKKVQEKRKAWDTDIQKIVSNAIKELDIRFTWVFAQQFWYISKNNIKVEWKNFIEFIMAKIEELRDDCEIQISLYHDNKLNSIMVSGKEDFLIDREIQKVYCNVTLSELVKLNNDMQVIDEKKITNKENN